LLIHLGLFSINADEILREKDPHKHLKYCIQNSIRGIFVAGNNRHTFFYSPAAPCRTQARVEPILFANTQAGSISPLIVEVWLVTVQLSDKDFLIRSALS